MENKWSWKKWANGVIVIPDDTAEIVKYIISIVVAILAHYGYGNLDEIQLLIISILVKALVDRFHYFWKYQ